MTTNASTYRPAQIWLHWFVVLGVFAQIGFHDPIVAVIDARTAGHPPVPGDEAWACIHVAVGNAIFLAVLACLALRWRHGVPGHAPGTSALQARIASTMHAALHGLLLAMIFTGMLTWNGLAPLGEVHFAINIALSFAALAHAAAALFNQFVRRDGTLARMKPRF